MKDIPKEINEDEESLLDKWIKQKLNKPRMFLVYLLIFIGIFFMGLPFLLTRDWGFIQFDTGTGVIGDTFGGIFGPFVALLGVIMTFFAFYIQYRANQIQFNMLKRQISQQEKEHIDNRVLYYYELIKDVKKTMREEIGINSFMGSGGRSFTYILNEVKHLYSIIKNIDFLLSKIESKDDIGQMALQIIVNEEELPQDREVLLMSIAWHYTFTGIARFHSRQSFFIDVCESLDCDFLTFQKTNADLVINLVGDDNFGIINRALNSYYQTANETYDEVIINVIPNLWRDDQNVEKVYDFKGHKEFLSTYFQLLFQVVKYINSSSALKYSEKYQLVKLIRAQMSNDEMAVFFLNSLYEFGYPWEHNYRAINKRIDEIASPNNCLITKYNIVKNISRINGFKVHPVDIYPDLTFAGYSRDENIRRRKFS